MNKISKFYLKTGSLFFFLSQSSISSFTNAQKQELTL